MGSVERIMLLGCPVDNVTMEETLEKIEAFIASGNPHQHVVVNADKMVKIVNDQWLYDVVSSCDLINADGQPVVWASKILGHPLKERVTGIDLMGQLIGLASQKDYSIFFLGAKETIVEKVVLHYRTKYPTLRIVGYRNGYWRPEEEEEVVNVIRTAKPDILFVGISSPKKEMFLNAHLNEMNVPFCMGVGGAFDVAAGKTKRAPYWMREVLPLEWLWRLLQEPGRLWKRYLIDDMKFFYYLFLQRFKLRDFGTFD